MRPEDPRPVADDGSTFALDRTAKAAETGALSLDERGDVADERSGR